MSSTSRKPESLFLFFIDFIHFFKITNEKRTELQHRANILISFKSAKDSAMYKLDENTSRMFGSSGPIPPIVPGDKDL